MTISFVPMNIDGKFMTSMIGCTAFVTSESQPRTKYELPMKEPDVTGRVTYVIEGYDDALIRRVEISCTKLVDGVSTTSELTKLIQIQGDLEIKGNLEIKNDTKDSKR